MALNMAAAIGITANVSGEQSVERLNSKLTQLGKTGEMSAKQIAQAYRTLPAQLQDVVVSLAGGQNPLMVLLTQGSQVATQFGSVRGAIAALGTVLTPAAVGFTTLAAGIGGVALAAYQGYEESIRLQKQLAITGNYAGMTADSFERAAARIQAASGATASASRELLMGAAGSGAFGPSSIDAVTTAMTRLQKLTGQSSEDIVKQFSSMSRGVADWAAQANKSYNFLNVEQYKYIKQLEDQGDKEAAMRITAEALSDALSRRNVQLGYLERGWLSVKSAASDAWNSMLNIGRQDTFQEQIDSLEQMLRTGEIMRDRMRARGQPVPDGESPEQRSIKAQIAALREAQRLQQQAATSTATTAAQNQTAIEAERKAQEDANKAKREAISLENQRQTILKNLQNEVTRLKDGEEEMTVAMLKSLGATTKQIDKARELVAQRDALKKSQDQDRERTQILEQLNDAVVKLAQGEDELTIAKLQSLGASDEQIARARELMRQRLQLIAADRELEEAAKQQKELEEEAIRRKKELADAGKRVYDETRTPAEKLNIEMARLNDLLGKGAIDWDTYARATFKAHEEFDKLSEKGEDTMKELKKAIEGWGRQAADAFVDFTFGAKGNFTDMVNSILKDIARMLIYKNVMQPLFGAISGWMPSFANGGIMTSGGPLPLNKYANGGIANSPQLALFGEGRMPEAYVPLPDGRSIPVTMQGGAGGNTSVVVNVNMESGQTKQQSDGQRGTDLGAVIAGAVKQELINQRRPGGLLAA